ncbi:SPOR domain-containing protein [Pacificibacter sp.]|uniref:SPOR domain-containing protein n=1 Tax=Pacificibacter sp. TaxID=1917866 RepID=UPI00321A7027
MKITKITVRAIGAAFVGVFGMSIGPVLASSDGPAEIPPASFAARQYVDSTGCAFVRSLNTDAPLWAPRLARDGTVLCGFKPSLPSPEPDVVPAPDTDVVIKDDSDVGAVEQPLDASDVKEDEAVAEALDVAEACDAAESTESSNCAAQEDPSTNFVVKRLPAGLTVRTSDGGTLTTTEPTFVRVPVEAVDAEVAEVPEPGVTLPVSVPENMDEVEGPESVDEAAPEMQMASAEQTAEPEALVTPPAPAVQKVDAVPTQSKRPQLRPEESQVAKVASPDSATANAQTDAAVNAKPQPVRKVATHTMPPKLGKRYVQVGIFGVPSNAERSIARLHALGLPVASQFITLNGKRVKVILSGPFETHAQTKAALKQARSAGYKDAFARR